MCKLCQHDATIIVKAVSACCDSVALHFSWCCMLRHLQIIWTPPVDTLTCGRKTRETTVPECSRNSEQCSALTYRCQWCDEASCYSQERRAGKHSRTKPCMG